MYMLYMLLIVTYALVHLAIYNSNWLLLNIGFILDPESGSDFKLDNFTAGPCEGFDTHYGEKGYHGDGDVTKLENLDAFSSYVMDITNNVGVHFAMADGVSECISHIIFSQFQ